MSSRKRVALVGAGRMGRNHLRVFSDHPAFEVVAVVDPVWKSEGRKAPGSAHVHGSLETLGSDDFDVAVVAASTELHAEIGMKLTRLGRPILLEKPIASTLEQAEKLIQAADSAGVPLFVGHLERLNPAVLKLKELIEAGWLGRIIHYNFTRVGGYPENVKSGNNVLIDLAIHDLDVLNFLAGRFQVLNSICHSSWKPGVLDTAEILLEGGGGESRMSASIHVNWVTPTKIRSLRVTGTRGVCMVDYMLQSCTLFGGNLLRNRSEPEIDFQSLVSMYQSNDKIDFGVVQQEPLKVQANELALALQGKPHRLCPARDAMAALALAQQAVPREEGLR